MISFASRFTSPASLKFTMYKKYLIAFFILLTVLPSTCLYAKDHKAFGPIALRVQSPLYLQGLGLTPQRAKTIEKGDLELKLAAAYSNIFEKGKTGTDELFIDMELLRLGFNLNYGIREGMEVGMELPFYHDWHGFLDSFIQKFHSFFGFPNGGREAYPNNEYHYYLKRNGRDIFNYPPQTFSIGDLSLSFKNEIFPEKKYSPLISWFTELKFPTGDEKGGVSNGGFDFGLGVLLDKNYKRIHGYLNVEYIVIGGGDIFGSDIHDANLGFAAGLEVSIIPTLSVLAQINGSTPMYNGTGKDVYEGIPLDLVIGFRGEEERLIANSDLIWQFGFGEDVTAIGPSVDFTVFASIGSRIHLKDRRLKTKD